MVIHQQHSASPSSIMESTRTSPSNNHHAGASSSANDRSAAFQAAAAVAAAVTGFNSVGMGISGLVPVGLMNHLQHHDHQQQQLHHHHQQQQQQQYQNGGNNNNNNNNNQRKQREFIPDNKKDDSYWDRRRRNNEAAKRSREKRRLNDMVLESRVLELTKENHILRAQLSAVRDKYGINPDALVSIDQVLATLPSPDQVLSLPRPRSRLLSGLGNSGCGRSSGGGSVSPAPSNRSLSPPMVHLPPGPVGHHHHQQHHPSGQQQQQQQRQSVLMSMNRSQRTPSPLGKVGGQIGYNHGGQHHHQQQQQQNSSYRFQPSSDSTDHHPFQDEQSDHHHHHLHQQIAKNSSQRPAMADRALPPLPALTPVPVNMSPDPLDTHQQQQPLDAALHLNGAPPDRRGDVVVPSVGYFDLCSSSSSHSSSSSSSHPGSSDDGSHSPIDPAAIAAGGRVLPLKLRHKTHLGDRDVAAATASAAAALLTLNDIKPEPEGIDDSPASATGVGDSIADSTVAPAPSLELNAMEEESIASSMDGNPNHPSNHHLINNQHLQYQMGTSGRRSTESSDGRDSGISSGGDWPSSLAQQRTSSSRSYSIGHHGNQQHLYQQQSASKRMRMSPNSTNHHPYSNHPVQQQQQQQPGRKMATNGRFANNPIHHRRPAAQENDEEADSVSAVDRMNNGGGGGGNESSDDNDELRSHIARLASELESLKTLMMGAAGSAGSSTGSSSSIRASNKNNANNLRFRH